MGQAIGILGGMGPEASVDLYQKLIQRAYKHASDDMEAYPQIFINNIPIPNIFQQHNKNIGRYLGEQATLLERIGAQVIGVACNSAHFFFQDIRYMLSQDVYLVNMIKEVARRVQEEGYNSVGILSSKMSRPLYLDELEKSKVFTKVPLEKDQDKVEDVIFRILSGERTAELKETLFGLADRLVKDGAECVVLGCTDLPLILKETDVEFPLRSSTDILADELFKFSIG